MPRSIDGSSPRSMRIRSDIYTQSRERLARLPDDLVRLIVKRRAVCRLLAVWEERPRLTFSPPPPGSGVERAGRESAN